MSLATQRLAITDYFHDNWDEGDAVVGWPNKKFVTPASAPFLLLDILTFARGRASIGISEWFNRREGAVQVDIYVPEGTGIGVARSFADIVEALFESKEITTSDNEVIRFRAPNTTSIAPNVVRASNIEDSFFRLVVSCGYYVDEIKTI
jgi:hypothetical protein